MGYYAREIDRIEQEVSDLALYLIDDMGKGAGQPIRGLLSGLHETLMALEKVELYAHRTDEALSRRSDKN